MMLNKVFLDIKIVNRFTILLKDFFYKSIGKLIFLKLQR